MSQRKAVLHCNAGGRFGMGHLMRVLSLATEALRRDWDVTVVGDLDERAVQLIGQHAPAATAMVVATTEIEHWILAEMDPQTTVLHLDTYWLGELVVPEGRPLVSSIQDGTFGQRRADLAIDPNLDAETRLADRASEHYLLGIDAVAIREQVLRQRDVPTDAGRRVLVVLGGTDPHGATAQVVDAFGVIESPIEISVIAPAARHHDVVAAAQRSHHRVSVHTFVSDLPAFARQHDVVVTAAGTSVWDFACMGLPMALVCVADNQEVGYAAAVRRGLGIGVGAIADPDLGARMAMVGELLEDPAALAAMSAAGRAAVDGLGGWRIVSAWEQLTTVAVRDAAGALVARPATIDDARMLFDWRNDPSTRASSRTTDELTWESHLGWVQATLARPDRRLLVVQEGDLAIGTVRWDDEGEDTWEVSITVAPEARGGGRALGVLQAGERALTVPRTVRLQATVRDDNAGSRRLFERAGYLPHRPADADGFLTFARWRVG